MRKAAIVTALALVAALGWPQAAGAVRWVIKGRGYGHGAGMSQYGAYGFARHGRGYHSILGHYYRHTRVGEVDGRLIRVLLDRGVGSVGFTRARRACGRRLDPERDYRFVLAGSAVLLRRGGATLEDCGGGGSAAGERSLKVRRHGVYRGRLIAKGKGSELLVINEIGLEDYVQGVVPNEVPSGWPRAALRAQAVAARSYGLATRRGGSFDHYDDTRSQVYGGRSSETAATNQAVAGTRHEVVKHRGSVATTYFFSTSGGETENVEFALVGSPPSPYLKAVRDPYDNLSPVHRWTVRLTDAQMESALKGLFGGNLRRIEVTRRGRSPRIVAARVVGSNDSSNVSGETLRARLGARSTWMRFEKRR